MAKFRKILREVRENGRLDLERGFCQHGSTTVYAHSIRVAVKSCYLARLWNLKVDEESLIRGALLHDYFLYDWHIQDGTHRLHGFTHPGRALYNASQDFDLTETERDIIRHHMFPLVPLPPRSREAWLVCLADKICAWEETLQGITKREKKEDGKERTDLV